MDDYAKALLDVTNAVVPRWIERSVTQTMEARSQPVSTGTLEAARRAGEDARVYCVAALTALLEADVDAQGTTPLAILRSAVSFPTRVLQEAGVPMADRDDYLKQRFPEDAYDLSPANFGDIDPDLVDPGLAWGASKAMSHMRRHGSAGQ